MSKQGGFTLVELITVMVVLGILSAIALPRIMDNSAFIGAAFNADVVSALRYAQKSAVSHRRLVCASIGATTVALLIATPNPASACNCVTDSSTCGCTPASSTCLLPSPDGAPYQSKDAAIQASAIPVPVGGVLYFQPAGTITFDGAGANIYSGKISITGRLTTPIKIEGATGYVE